jgi:hypothetical protein
MLLIDTATNLSVFTHLQGMISTGAQRSLCMTLVGVASASQSRQCTTVTMALLCLHGQVILYCGIRISHTSAQSSE